MNKGNEQPGTNPGFAIIGQFIFKNVSHEIPPTKANSFELGPGKGIIFFGNLDQDSQAIKFDQSDVEEALKRVPAGQLQLFAIVDGKSGALFISDGTPERLYGLNQQIPVGQRVIALDYGKMTFFGIWGETAEEARATLEILQKRRLSRN